MATLKKLCVGDKWQMLQHVESEFLLYMQKGTIHNQFIHILYTKLYINTVDIIQVFTQIFQFD